MRTFFMEEKEISSNDFILIVTLVILQKDRRMNIIQTHYVKDLIKLCHGNNLKALYLYGNFWKKWQETFIIYLIKIVKIVLLTSRRLISNHIFLHY